MNDNEEDIVAPPAINAIEEREQENLKSDLKTLLIKATMPLSEDERNRGVDEEKVDTKYFKELGMMIKRSPWSIQYITSLALDLLLLTDGKSIPETAKESNEAVRYRRAVLALQFLSFIVDKSKWARRSICESVQTLRDITSFIPHLYQQIVNYSFKKKLRLNPDHEAAHLWRCRLRVAVVRELFYWAEKWSSNKYLRLATQYLRKKGFTKDAILSGEEVLRPPTVKRAVSGRHVVRTPRRTVRLPVDKRDPILEKKIQSERSTFESLDFSVFEARVRELIESTRASVVAIKECLDILFPPLTTEGEDQPMQEKEVQAPPQAQVDGAEDIFDENLLQDFVHDEQDLNSELFENIEFDDDAAAPPAAQQQQQLNQSVSEDELNKSNDSQHSISLEFRLDSSGNAVLVPRAESLSESEPAPAPPPPPSSSSSAAAVAVPLFDDAVQPVIDILKEEYRALEKRFLPLLAAEAVLTECSRPRRTPEQSEQLEAEVSPLLDSVEECHLRCGPILALPGTSEIEYGALLRSWSSRNAAKEDEEDEDHEDGEKGNRFVIDQEEEEEEDVAVLTEEPPLKKVKLLDGGIAAAAADNERMREERDRLAGRTHRVPPRGRQQSSIIKKEEEEPSAAAPGRRAPPAAKKMAPAPAGSPKKGGGKGKLTQLQNFVKTLGYTPDLSPTPGKKRSTNIL